jgi:hypothetical protein
VSAQAPGDLAGDERFASGVVLHRSIGEILDLVRDLRKEPVSDPDSAGEALANSDAALRLLEAIAALRPVADVVDAAVQLDSGGSAGGSSDLDALTLVETAALTVPPRQAAALAVGLMRSGRPRLSQEIADQVARHRMSREVSVFVDALLCDGEPGLATLAMGTLHVAGEQRSMRAVARIFLSLRALERERIADRLLDSIFPPAHTVRELKELATVLGELSPHEAVLPDRIFALSNARLTVGQIAELARELHDGKTANTAMPFIQDAAKAREITEIIELYRMLRHDGLTELATLVVTTAAAERRAGDVVTLALTLDREQPDDGILLRQRAAARTDLRDLVDLVPRWHHRLKKQFPALIAAIVAAHPIDRLQQLAAELTETGQTDWAQQLRVAAVRNPENRTGAELARLLWRISEPRVRRSEGRRLTEWLATRFGRGEDAAVPGTRDLLIEYVRELGSQDSAGLIRTLWDGLLASTRDAGRLGGLAEGLWRAGLPDYAAELLRQWLEQQELVEPAALPTIARQLRTFLPDAELAKLLTQTVGQWAPTMRAGAITRLAEAGLQEEAAVVRRAGLR